MNETRSVKAELKSLITKRVSETPWTENELLDYLRVEFRDFDATDRWAEVLSRDPQNENPNNILTLWLLGKAPMPAELKHVWNGGLEADIDTDFPPDKRDAIKQYLISKYGDKNCMEVATYGGIQVKGAIQDLARVAGLEPAEVTKVTTSIKYNVNDDEQNSLEYIREHNPVVDRFLDENPTIGNWVEKMEDIKRNVGKHASAFVVSTKNLYETLPVIRGRNKEIIAAYPESSSVKALNALGIIKLDLLGLDALNIIGDAVKLVKEKGVDIDWDTIDVNDPNPYTLLDEGYNAEIFQMNTGVAARIIETIKPKSIHDLSAVNALIRPACLEAKSHEWYRRHKLGKFIPEEYPVWKNLKGKVSDEVYASLDANYGIVLTQEQVMLMLAEFCKISLDETNKARKVMTIPDNKKSKEHRDYMDKLRKAWMDHGSKLVGEKEAWQWWEVAIGSMSYGFCAAHSYSYSVVAFRQLWLKYYYPQEFYAACLRKLVSEAGKDGQSPLMKVIIEARERSIPIEAPKINVSEVKMKVDGTNIFLGYEQVKGIGENAAQDIIARGPYESFDDFLEKHKKGTGSKVTKTTIESLIYANAFREWGDRPALLEDYWRRLLPKKRKDEPIEIPEEMDILKEERQCLSLVLSKPNPIQRPYGFMSITRALDTDEGRIVKIKAVLEKSMQATARSGKPYFKLTFTDLENTTTVLAWSNAAATVAKMVIGETYEVMLKNLDGGTMSFVKLL